MRFYRNCPNCGCELNYSTKWSCAKAEKLKKECKSCSKSGTKNPQFGNVGDKNPFFGKHHTEDFKNNSSKEKKGKSIHSEEHKASLKKIMTEKNPMAGKSIYNVWVEKYGEEEANQKMLSYKKLKSKENSGENNNMYGKPSPNGSGNGWSGWYNGWFFRSIHELSFMINYIERFKMVWSSAESNKYKIEYIDYEGKKRNYFPDFIIDNKYLIECKPKKLHNSITVLSKKEAAKSFCLLNNLTYKIIAPILISEEEIKKLFLTKKIIFLPKYERKFIEKYLK